VTELFGLVVNEEKTGVSRRWMELNSSIYDGHRHQFVAKPVLSFLRPSRSVPGGILNSVISGTSSFRFSLRLRIVCEMMRYEITLRGVLDSLSSLSRRWRAELLRRRWFRVACLVDAPPIKERGVSREQPVVVAPPPDSRLFPFLNVAAAQLSRDRVDSWSGVRVVPYSCKIDRRRLSDWKKKAHLRAPASRYRFAGWKFVFSWPKELFEFCSDSVPSLMRHSCLETWTDDHPFLSRAMRIFVTLPPESRRSYRNPLFAPSFPTQFPLGYR